MTCLLSRVFLLDIGTVQYLLSRYTTLQYTTVHYTTFFSHYGAPAPDPGFGTWAIRDETSPRGEGVWGDLGILVHSSMVADQKKRKKKKRQLITALPKRSWPTLSPSSWRYLLRLASVTAQSNKSRPNVCPNKPVHPTKRKTGHGAANR